MNIKNSMKIFIMVFLIIGIVFVGLCAVFAGVNIYIKNNYNETDAVVMGFEHQRSASGKSDTNYTLISYVVEDTEYQTTISAYSSSWRVGDTIKVYTDSDNPDAVKVTLSPIFFIVFGFVGSVFAVIGFVMLSRAVKLRKKKKQLFENGLTLHAEIVDFFPNTRIAVNGMHPYIVVVEYDELGQKHRFVSENVWERMNDSYIGDMVTVYYAQNNMNNYYVDINTLFQSKSHPEKNIIYH